MRKIQLRIALVMGAFFVGCTAMPVSEEKEVPVITVNPDLSEMTSAGMSQHFINDRYVILRGVMLTDIDRLIDWGDRFVVFDRRGQQVAIFDTTGNCICQIKRLGKGPAEYVQLRDCMIDNANDELILYADQPGKLIWFDREGNYLREERWTESYFDEMICATGGELYAINGGTGRTMASETIARITKNPKMEIKETQLVYKSYFPNLNAGVRLTSNGNNVWLSRPFDYTLYCLDTTTKQFNPCYKLDLGSAALPDGAVTLESTGRQIRENGFIYHVPKVNFIANYLFFNAGSDYFMMDTVSNTLTKLGMIPVCGSVDFALGGYGLFENQNRRIVHAIPVTALLMWSESMKNGGPANAQLEELIAANAEFMNPVLLFQDVI